MKNDLSQYTLQQLKGSNDISLIALRNQSLRHPIQYICPHSASRELYLSTGLMHTSHLSVVVGTELSLKDSQLRVIRRDDELPPWLCDEILSPSSLALSVSWLSKIMRDSNSLHFHVVFQLLIELSNVH